MQQTTAPTSKAKIALIWIFCVGTIVFWLVFWIWNGRDRMNQQQAAPDLVRSILSFVAGGLFLVIGVVGYLIALFTQCLTFNFSRPIWRSLKSKVYLANIAVPVALALGFGFVLSAFTSPLLATLGLSPGMANMLPVFLMIGLVQFVQLWVNIWTPMTKRVLTKRLAAQGITPEQIETGFRIGISNPTVSSFKRFGAIEEDIGALWALPDQLYFCGDIERFGITRAQLVTMERKADAGSTSILSGIAHVILHVALPDGNVRQIRLHTLGQWTLGQKREAMETLARAITEWHSSAGLPPIPGTAQAV